MLKYRERIALADQIISVIGENKRAELRFSAAYEREYTPKFRDGITVKYDGSIIEIHTFPLIKNITPKSKKYIMTTIT